MSLVHSTNRQTTERRTLVADPLGYVSFEAFDAKGRQIGCEIETKEVEFVPTEKPYGYCVEPGHFYTACVEATRDGRRFGSSQRTQYFVTKDERNAYVAKRIVASRKAAAKKAA